MGKARGLFSYHENCALIKGTAGFLANERDRPAGLARYGVADGAKPRLLAALTSSEGSACCPVHKADAEVNGFDLALLAMVKRGIDDVPTEQAEGDTLHGLNKETAFNNLGFIRLAVN